MLRQTPAGLCCDAGGFHIDPTGPVPLAIVTHAHRDHLRGAAERIICAEDSVPLLRLRLGADAPLDPLPYGAHRRLGRVDVSLHPAGHILGSVQVRVAPAAPATDGSTEVWVVSGDYARQPNPTCRPFETVACDVFVTEATFALPIYRWPAVARELDAMHAWMDDNRAAGRPSLVLAYAAGKAQRLLAAIADRVPEPVLVHGAVLAAHAAYRETGVALPDVVHVDESMRGAATAGRVIVAPPSVLGTPWMARMPRASVAMASGWMRVRGRRRWKGVDRGFVISDHADWDALLSTIDATGARRVFTTHGYADTLARYLSEQGLEAAPMGAAPPDAG